MISPPTMKLCGELGRFTSTTRADSGAVASELKSFSPFGVAGADQLPNASVRSGMTSSSERLETTKIVALSGRSQVCLKFTRSSRVSAPTDSTVPEPP